MALQPGAVGARSRGAVARRVGLPVPGAPLPVRLRVAAGRFSNWLADCLRSDLDRGRGFLWIPVAFALGVSVYFALPREPHWPTLAALGLAAACAAARARSAPTAFPALVLVTAMLAGLALASAQTARVAAPVIRGERTVELDGWVEAREPRPDGAVRYIVRVHHLKGLGRPRTPARVRFTARGKGPAPRVGDGIAVLARLAPPRGPVEPGGYDGARSLFFEGIGATGFSYGMPKAADLGPAPADIRLRAMVARVRDGIGTRLRAALPGENGEIAATLLVGDRGGIPEETQDAIRLSGLGHILAISGLHMALVAGTIFGTVRFVLAAIPGLALRRPIKKWAAVAALMAGLVYLILSGGAVATIRAFVMAAVALLAVLVDRPALTLRSVAVAALVVMILDPAAVLSPGFQMSFAAVIALVAAYEWQATRERSGGGDRNAGHGRRVLRTAALWMGGLALTSFVAGLVTAPIGALHFHRLAPLGLLGNLLAMPFVSLIVMPFGVVSVALMPLGLDPLVLPIMGLGLDAVVGIAEWVAGLSGQTGGVGRMPAAAVLAMTGGLLWLALWQAGWRLLGVVPIAAGLAIAPLGSSPDLLISDDGRAVAVRGTDGRLRIATAQGGAFAAAMWLRADGDTRDPLDPAVRDAVRCDDLGCTLTLPAPIGLRRGREAGAAANRPATNATDGIVSVAVSVRKARPPPVAAFAEDPAAFVEDCVRAEILITRHDAPPGCSGPRLIVDRNLLRQAGALALTWQDDPPYYRLQHARPRTARPWTATPVVRR
ncbi:ComEC/Rec2 family competence protein [Amorphus sp. MBR-141]